MFSLLRIAIVWLARMPLDFPTLLDPGGRDDQSVEGTHILRASLLIALSGRIRYTVTGELDWANEHVVRVVSKLLPQPSSK